jgi:EmrB/QacA subfamily drug resistance transporter
MSATLAARTASASRKRAGPGSSRWAVLAVVLAAQAMDLMDSTIANVAGPSIRRDLGGAGATLQWLSAAYTLAFSVLLITGARLGDRFGRRRVFLVGAAGFTLASAACAAADSPTVLIATRALQGGFGALLVPQGFGMLRETFAEQEMSQVFAAFGPTLGLATIAAPVLAGVLIGADLFGAGWRLVFLINVPVGLIVLATAARVLPRGSVDRRVRLDPVGMVLVGLAATAIVYPLIEGRSQGWPIGMFIVLAIGVTLLAAFVRSTLRRREDGLIEPSLLRNRVYLTGLGVGLMFFGSFAGLLLVVSLFCQLGEGFSPVHAGLTILPMSVGLVIAMLASYGVVERLGRRLIHTGAALVAVGAVVIALTAGGAASVTSWDLAPGLFIVGLGGGCAFGQLFDFILAGVSMREVGSASGVLSASQQLANALGVAVLGTVFFSGLAAGQATHALAVTAWACLVPIVLAFLGTCLLPRRARRTDSA